MGVHKMTTQKEELDPIAGLYNRAIVDLKDIYNSGKQEPLPGAESPDERGPKAEECWALLGHQDLLAARPWPKADAALLTDDTVTVAVQVNGKLRTTLELAVDITKEAAEAAALADPKITSALEGKSLKKVIVVPGKIINLVAV
jgi:hypothetical protein